MVESLKLSTFQTLAPRFGVLRVFFFWHSKLWRLSLERQIFFSLGIQNLSTKVWKVGSFNLLDFHISALNIGNLRVFHLLAVWKIEGSKFYSWHPNFSAKVVLCSPFSIKLLFGTPIMNGPVCLVCRRWPRNSQNKCFLTLCLTNGSIRSPFGLKYFFLQILHSFNYKILTNFQGLKIDVYSYATWG